MSASLPSHAISAQHYDSLPPGTPVLVWTFARTDSPLLTRTVGEVWTLGSGERVVRVEGRTGGIALTHLDVMPPGWIAQEAKP